ncbi:hypothetical protein [Sphingomonas sp.]|uniref:hypothetical protein n=1 Tax=Sphingomonas sp. TaxID=28214 RepID=UPI003AFF67A2
MTEQAQPLPWRTEPSALGSTTCAWCHRDINLPALPCSTEPVEGLLRMNTRAGQGERCKYELSTRAPELLDAPLAL